MKFFRKIQVWHYDMVKNKPSHMTLIHSVKCTIIYKLIPYSHIFTFKRISCSTLLKYWSVLQIICSPEFPSALVQQYDKRRGLGSLFFLNKWIIIFCHKHIDGTQFWNAPSYPISCNFLASLPFSMTPQTPSSWLWIILQSSL